MDVRRQRRSDIARIASLCERELCFDRDAKEIPRLLVRRPSIGFVVTEGTALVGVIFGSMREAGDDEGSIDLLVVDRAFRRQGAARLLVDTLEREFARHGRTRIGVRGNPPYYIWPGVDIHYTSAICFFEDLGYTRGRCVVNMEVDLSSAPLQTLPLEQRLRTAGIEIRRADHTDRDGLHRWVSSGSDWPAAWADEAVAALRERRAGCHIAMADEDFVSFCCFGINQEHVVGPMATHPAMRGLGLGMVLMKRCLVEQRDRGLLVSELGWAGPLSLYADKLGAQIGRCFWQYEKAGTNQ